VPAETGTLGAPRESRDTAMARPGFYKILEHPFVYNAVNMVVGPGGQHLEGGVYRRLFKDCRGLVLDVGCGPRLRTPSPDGIVVGVDVNPAYLRSYTGGFVDQDSELFLTRPAGRTRFGYLGTAENLPFPDNLFDEVRNRAMLHHLDADGASVIIREMVRCLRPGGRTVIMEPVWPRVALLRPFAWLVHKFDRGEWIRTQEDLVRLAESATQTRWTQLRYTSAYSGLEAVVLTLEKPLAKAA
jgi:SAM-dependent methyltransferase